MMMKNASVPRYMVKEATCRGAWVIQLVEHPALAQITISQFVSSNPALSPVVMAWNREPAS